ncbi:McrB family protein [uncultured Mesonia sp.]|uniref:McrB family protein n=1 Tax=uncultured Mesonia sp. TaxID=399731 RepID=UPI00374E477B
MGYGEQLELFLKQAKTNNLKTKHFKSDYLNTKVKVSFGQGNTARIPWISFLIEPNTTSKGIYPVFLYYKEFELLILAYGISESNEPEMNWKLNSNETINEFFKKKFKKKPDRYGTSYVAEVYDLNKKLNINRIEEDLKDIIKEYRLTINSAPVIKKASAINHPPFNVKNFKVDCKNAGLIYSDILITRFVSSLLTKPFVILTGLSGSGKTKLAQAFVQWICQEESQYRIIPVGADWTNREPLLGYPNALKPEEYVKPDNGVIDLILQANSNPKLPHFLILDEMNLSHVERYFADFLSVMESNEEIPLYAEGTVDNGVPSKLKVPANLFIIGTVNIDETTNMFSPKVLDRANTIEFRINNSEMEDFLSSANDLNMKALLEEGEKTGKGATMAQNFISLSNNKSFTTKDLDEINKTLLNFFGELQKTGAEFGYRTASEILRLINQLDTLNSVLTTSEKLDIAIMQKLLPKLHGSRRKLTPILETLGSFCLKEDLKIIKDVFEKDNFEFYKKEGKKLVPTDGVLYPLSLEKIARMYKGAIDNGFASYAEA